MTRFRSSIVCVLSLALALSGMQSPAVKPITKRGLLEALKIGGLTQSELVRKIRERGVNFAVTAEVEQELRRAGAAPEVIQAARDNYHDTRSRPRSRRLGLGKMHRSRPSRALFNGRSGYRSVSPEST